MAFFISERLGDFILDGLELEVPKKHEMRSRIENFGYTIFDVETLRVTMTDKVGFSILNKINDKDNLKTILTQVSNEKKIPYLFASVNALKNLANWQNNNLIHLNRKVNSKINEIQSTHPIQNGPNQISWLITNQCNLNCSHCGNTSRTKLKDELTKEEAFNFIDQCADMNVFILNISGGEPFLRENWFEILSYARKNNIEKGITTNGTIITEETVKKIKQLEPFNVHISVDGIGEVHDKFRNRTGVFDSVLKTIKLFKKYKIPFGITTSITKKNFNDLDNVKDFVKENRINSWNLYYALPIGCLKKIESVSTNEFYEFAKKIISYKEELKDITYISVGDSLGYYGDLEVRDWFWNGCGAGIVGCAVDAEGNVKGCPLIPSIFNEGNIRNRPLKEIWLDKKSFSYNRKPEKLSKHCKNCKHSNYCRGGCKSSMYAQETDFKYNNYCLYQIEQSRKCC